MQAQSVVAQHPQPPENTQHLQPADNTHNQILPQPNADVQVVRPNDAVEPEPRIEENSVQQVEKHEQGHETIHTLVSQQTGTANTQIQILQDVSSEIRVKQDQNHQIQYGNGDEKQQGKNIQKPIEQVGRVASEVIVEGSIEEGSHKNEQNIEQNGVKSNIQLVGSHQINEAIKIQQQSNKVQQPQQPHPEYPSNTNHSHQPENITYHEQHQEPKVEIREGVSQAQLLGSNPEPAQQNVDILQRQEQPEVEQIHPSKEDKISHPIVQEVHQQVSGQNQPQVEIVQRKPEDHHEPKTETNKQNPPASHLQEPIVWQVHPPVPKKHDIDPLSRKKHHHEPKQTIKHEQIETKRDQVVAQIQQTKREANNIPELNSDERFNQTPKKRQSSIINPASNTSRQKPIQQQSKKGESKACECLIM